MSDRQNYDVDCTQVIREGRQVRVQTWADISPEMVLSEHTRVFTEALLSKVPYEGSPLGANWRKRLANVTET